MFEWIHMHTLIAEQSHKTNKLLLFSITQHRFIIIQIVSFTCVLHVSAPPPPPCKYDTHTHHNITILAEHTMYKSYYFVN
jgi:hypothetical protein